MPDMTCDEMIEGLPHEITRAHCHLEDADRDLGVVTDQPLGPFACGLQDHLHDLEQFDEAIRVTLTSLTERLGSPTSGRAASDHRGDGYTPKNRGGSTDIP